MPGGPIASESNSLGSHLASYADDGVLEVSQEEDRDVCSSTSVPLPSITSAPLTESVGIIQALVSKESATALAQCSKDANLPADIMFAPLQGPLLPQQRWGGLERAYNQNSASGRVEKCVINDAAFDIQLHEFQRKGRARDPSDFSIAETDRFREKPLQESREAVAGKDSLSETPYYRSRAEAFPSSATEENLSRKQRRQRRFDQGDPSSETYLGPWAPPIAEEERRAQLEAEAEEKRKVLEEEKEPLPFPITPDPSATVPTSEVSATDVRGSAAIALHKSRINTVLHLRNEKNFHGLSWIDRPLGFQERDDDQVNYLPKKLVHTYVGHKMGVQAVRFFPVSGHLLLSASLDGQCKIWDVYNQRKCIRTYMGHEMAVRDIQFSHDGRKFYSCSLDKTICHWDTEYGKIIGAFTNDKTPYCLSVHPEKGMDNVFIIGSSNKHAVQFDANTGEITQEYCEHLATVNTVTFCENGRKIVTTADDKKMFIWEFGIPVVVKHIAEPHMRSMPAVRLHPSQKFLACQSMDNQILIYEATGRFRFQGPRRFRGHGNSGYAIRPGFSSDGRFIMSGDASGKAWFWDWKTLKNHRTLQAHDRVCMGTEWHPTLVSTVATCGWDGVVKLWE